MHQNEVYIVHENEKLSNKMKSTSSDLYYKNNEKNMRNLIDRSVTSNFKYNGKGKLAYMDELISFNHAFPKSTNKTSSFDLGGGEIKVFTLIRGKMMDDFRNKKATYKMENIGYIYTVKFDLKNKLIKNIKATFDFLDKNELLCLKNANIFNNKAIKEKIKKTKKLQIKEVKPNSILKHRNIDLEIKKDTKIKKNSKNSNNKNKIKKGGSSNINSMPWKCTMYSNI